MTFESEAIFERFRLGARKHIDLTLRPSYTDLLAKLGTPHQNLPPTLIVAGTNGKGSTCAFLRAMVEASGHTAHVYTSPHLIRFHERIRIAGELISEEELVSLLLEIEQKAEPSEVTYFEIGTAAALTAFARHKADVTLLEVGLGGRLDATNIVPDFAASIITRLSFDHRDYLGNTMGKIAYEKAGVMRRRTPCFTAPQPSQEAMLSLRHEATKMDAPLIVGGEDWRIEAVDADHFRFLGPNRKIEMIPRPALLGTHQLWNAGLAIAATDALPFDVSDEAVRKAMQKVEWPGRLQKITKGRLLDNLPKEWELWLDGGHNDSAGEVLAAQLRKWFSQDGRPVDLVYGMLSSKKPEEFLSPILPFVRRARTLFVEGEVPGYQAEELSHKLQEVGVEDSSPTSDMASALKSLSQAAEPEEKPARILVCGSLYLVGEALKRNTQSKNSA